MAEARLIDDGAVDGFDDDGDGAVVDEFDVHHGAELTVLDGDAGGGESGAERAVHGVGVGGIFGADKGGAVAVAGLCAKRELAHE